MKLQQIRRRHNAALRHLVAYVVEVDGVGTFQVRHHVRSWSDALLRLRPEWRGRQLKVTWSWPEPITFPEPAAGPVTVTDFAIL